MSRDALNLEGHVTFFKIKNRIHYVLSGLVFSEWVKFTTDLRYQTEKAEIGKTKIRIYQLYCSRVE